MRIINWALLAILGIWFALIGWFNSSQIEVNYVLGTAKWPLVAVMLICFLFGALLTLFVFGIKSLYWKTIATSLEKQLVDEHREAEEATIKAEFEQVKNS